MTNKTEKKGNGIPPLHPDIAQAVTNHDLIIFVGAGVSKLCGLPLWNQFANDMLQACYKRGYLSSLELHDLQINVNDAKTIITIAHSIFADNNDVESFYKEFETKLDYKYADISDVGKSVLDFINKSNATIITTNADRILDCYFEKDHIIYKESSFTSKLLGNDRYLIKIHGSVNNNESLVFTTDQYLERYRVDSFKSFLKEVFDNKTVLFIGYGLSEFELLDYIQIKADAENYNRKLFALTGYYSSQKIYQNYMEQYYRKINVTQIPYSMDNRGYDELARVLSAWADQMEQDTNIKSELLKRIDKDIASQNMKDLKSLAGNDDSLYSYSLKKIFETQGTAQNIEELIDKDFFDLV